MARPLHIALGVSFFWGNLGGEHKYHLANWGLVSRNKSFGEVGVPNMRDFNMALFASWGKRYFEAGDREWKKLLDYTYNTNSPNVLWARSNVESPFWKGFTWAISAAKVFYKWKFGNGRNISFWHDVWLGECSLKVQFWRLFSICNQQECYVAQVWDGEELKLSFRRSVDQEGLALWHQLVACVRQVQLSDAPDCPIWTLEANGRYSVKSFYKVINFGGVKSEFGDKFWKILCPKKYSCFYMVAYV